MKHTRILGGVAGALVLLTLALPHAQEPHRAVATVKEGVTAVLVDVVVRDRRGQPVKDLTQADFEILEDGVAQTIGSFTPILESVLGSTSGPAAAAAAPAGTAAAPAAPPAIRG